MYDSEKEFLDMNGEIKQMKILLERKDDDIYRYKGQLQKNW